MNGMDLTPEMVIESGMTRLRSLTKAYGITSPEVLATCVRWGSILDDVKETTWKS